MYRINKETVFLSFLTMEKKSLSTDFDLFRLSHGVDCKFCLGDLVARKFALVSFMILRLAAVMVVAAVNKTYYFYHNRKTYGNLI